jgi:hypothetical protein
MNMRMWMVDPGLMCRQHLLGEHNELHALAGSLKKGDVKRHVSSLKGLANANCIEVSAILDRHERIVAEMKARGYNHQSPLTEEDTPTGHLDICIVDKRVDAEAAKELLRGRCPECRRRMEQ